LKKTSSTQLQNYNKKRKFSSTPEPIGQVVKGTSDSFSVKDKVFTIQKHRARRQHYDFRLEDENGVLKSWAVPKGPSLNPQTKRLAVLTEDHPYDYLLFEGTIPKGNYGAGTVIVWDHGTYKTDKSLTEQFEKGKISIELYGKKLRGRFSLIRTRNENQWLLIKSNDEFSSTTNDITVTAPSSVLSGRSEISSNNKTKSARNMAVHDSKSKTFEERVSQSAQFRRNLRRNTTSYARVKLPKIIKPMLATPVDKAFNNEDWVFEIKWDGVRAVVFKENENQVRLQARSGNDITHRYPEITEALKASLAGTQYAILDGEIVVLDDNGLPDFQGHQNRMNIQSDREIKRLSEEIPTTLFLFDMLYHGGERIEGLGFVERRHLLAQTIRTDERVKISEFIEKKGLDMLRQTKELNLEGIMAKRKSSIYKEGIRSTDWLKIKNIKTQDCVVIGYTEGLGKRKNRFGSLLLAVYEPQNKKLRFVGHTGSGFDDKTIELIYFELQKLKAGSMPMEELPYRNRETHWVRPVLVAEVKFSSWTKDGIMRAPIFLRFRDDKEPVECLLEADQPISTSPAILENKAPVQLQPPRRNSIMVSKRLDHPSAGHEFSNPDKIFWRATKEHCGITKGDLIGYYDSISEYILPHLKDRPLSLSRYPDGIEGKSFYHKDWNMRKPDFVTTVRVHSEHRGEPVNYLVCNNKETLLWIANLGAIEMHPWYSRFNDIESCSSPTTLFEEECGLNFPDFIVFDLDPYIYSSAEKNKQEPEYNTRGFKAAVEVAYHLKDLFDELKIKSYVKTSGKTGLHIYVPIKVEYTYDQTRTFAEIIGKILLSRFPQKITMEWSTDKRTGKIFFDYNQNAKGKTIASVYSARPTVSATVSMPVQWEQLGKINPKEFTLISVPDLMQGKNDTWKGVLDHKQNLNKILSSIEGIVP
jgi:bifunctional non-homologous end joining protein LigD